MTPQEIFDTVATHLFTQGERCGERLDDEGDPAAVYFKCMYRGPNGTSCAVGVLIPDELYQPRMEDKNVYGLFRADGEGDPTNPCGLPNWMLLNLDLLEDLQGVHDTPRNWRSTLDMQSSLSEVALAHSLSSEVLSGLKFAWDTKAE